LWKLADFGLTSEGTSINFRMTEDARGTPGYRAPELLLEDNYGYTNKVDIWAMGCILHELVLGVKPFASDFAVLEHYRSKCQIDLHFYNTFQQESIKKLTALICKMLDTDHSSRPAAQTLLTEFIAFCQTAEQDDLLPASGLRHRETGATSIEDNAEPPLTVFRLTDPPALANRWNSGLSGWGVAEVMVNKSNTKYAVSSYSDDNMYFRCALLDTNSGEVTWTKEEEWAVTSTMPHPTPMFSEDGNHLAVYFEGSVEVLDTETAQVVHAWDVSSFDNILGVAVKRNGIGICLAVKLESATDDAAESRAVLTTKVVKSRTMPKGYSPIDVITTTFVTDVTLTYGGDGRRLSLGSTYTPSAQTPTRTEYVRFFWDSISRRLVTEHRYLSFDNMMLYKAWPVYAIDIDGLSPQFCYAYYTPKIRFTCCLLCSEDGEVTADFGLYGSLVIGFSPSGHIFFVKNSDPLLINKEGDEKFTILTDTGEMEVPNDQASKSSRYLWKWDSNLLKPTRWGKVLWDSLPPLERVKALAETEMGLTLLLDNGKLLFLTRVVFMFLHIH
jgi:hypothetical protein